MSKRRISKQQQTRINLNQEQYLDPTGNDLTMTQDGLVLSRFGRHAEVETANNSIIHCSIRPHIDSLVAGDNVVWQAEGADQGVVVSRYPRQSMLSRPDRHGKERVVAANITQLIIVVAVKPQLSWSLLDSYLVIAEHFHLKACILLNKVDLPSEPLIQTLKKIYSPLHYPLLFVSKDNPDRYQALHAQLKHQTSVFVGQSGVGKSTIIASLLPHEQSIQTASLSEQSELGRHTTSNSRLYHIPSGGALIDSPGVREFALWEMPLADLVYGFPEFRKLSAQCKYRNCDHQQSAGCAILADLAENKVAPERYNSLLKLISRGI